MAVGVGVVVRADVVDKKAVAVTVLRRGRRLEIRGQLGR